MDFAQQSKLAAAELAVRYLMDTNSVSAYFKECAVSEIVTDKYGHQEWYSRCDRADVLGKHIELINHEYWVSSSVELSGYYEMIGMAGVPTPEYRKTVSGIAGTKCQCTVFTQGNPHLWCFAPDFHQALAELIEKEEALASSCQGSNITPMWAA